MSMTTTIVRRVYVSAPQEVDISSLIQGLVVDGREPYVLSDVASLGSDLLTSVREAISAADLVLVVFGDSLVANPAFEAGLAVALGKPVLVVAPSGASLPSNIAELNVIRTRASDVAAIALAIRQSEGRRAARQPTAAAATGRALGQHLVDQLLERLRNGSEKTSESVAVSVLVDAIEASGGVTAMNAEEGHSCGD